ncbi:hypothetical protein PENTCL1PPCAC_23565, partial [Pristionchus entomophagus]
RFVRFPSFFSTLSSGRTGAGMYGEAANGCGRRKRSIYSARISSSQCVSRLTTRGAMIWPESSGSKFWRDTESKESIGLNWRLVWWNGRILAVSTTRRRHSLSPSAPILASAEIRS